MRVPGQLVPRGPSGGSPRPEPALAPPALCSRSWGPGCAFSFQEGEAGWGAAGDRFLCFGKISAAPECYLNSFCSLVPSRSGEKLETRQDAGSDTAGAAGTAGTAGTGSRRAPARGAHGSRPRGKDFPQPDPMAATRRLRSGLAAWAPGTRRSRSGGAGLSAARAPCGGQGRAPVRFGPPRAVRWDSGRWQSGRAHRPGSGRPALRAPRVLRQNCFTAPKGVCPRLRGLGRGGLPRWLVPPRLGSPTRQGAARPRAQPAASNPVSDAHATGLLKGNASGSFARESAAPRPEAGRPGGRGESARSAPQTRAVAPGLKRGAHPRGR